MKKILLIEDSKSLNEAIETVLKRSGYAVQVAFDGEQGFECGKEDFHDLIILDVLMPKMNGFEVLRALRKADVSAPVLMLTALSQDDNKIEGLDSGADDYMTKPFSMPELLARVRALIRRKGEPTYGNVLKHEGVSLNLSTHELSNNDKTIMLSRRECDLLKVFYETPEVVVERDKLVSKVWGDDNGQESNNLEVFISFLRKKLVYLEAPFGVVPVRGVGYRLK